MQLANYGEDEHDLRLRRIGGTRVYRVGTVAPAASASSRRASSPAVSGSGARWPTTAARGMRATLLVKKA